MHSIPFKSRNYPGSQAVIQLVLSNLSTAPLEQIHYVSSKFFISPEPQAVVH